MASNKDINRNESAAFKTMAKTMLEENKSIAETMKDFMSDWNKKSNDRSTDIIASKLEELTKIQTEQLERDEKYQKEQTMLSEAIIAARTNGDKELESKYAQMQKDSQTNKMLQDVQDVLEKQNAEKSRKSKLENGQKQIAEQLKANKKDATLLERLDKNSEYNQNQKELWEQKAKLYNEEHGTNISAESLKKQEKLKESLDKLSDSMSDMTKQLLNLADKLGEYKQSWDTRLQGSQIDYDSLAKTISNSIGVSPFIKQSAVYEKMNTAIDEGIAFNVEQRAFLDVLSDGVATTFDAFDDTLKNLVRVQQADSTAYRLGMEASLTKYLNSMYESTEYLSSVSDTVTSNLYEASSLLSAEDAIGTEYQIQKWLGSLYSVGMSSSSVGNISSALGKLLSGDVSVTDSGAGKLLVMAASNSGIDLGSALTEGLDSSELNTLLQAVVKYLQSIESDSSGNKVVLNQMASLFDMTVSDLKAASNLTNYTTSIYNNASDYNASSALASLQNSMNSYGSRMNMATYLGNLKDNMNYTLAGNISSNMGLYSLLYLGNMLNETVGGISIPSITTLFGGIDLETTVADLMLTAGLSGTILSSLGGIINGLGQVGGGVGVAAKAFGIDTSQSNTIKTLLSQGKSAGYSEGETSYTSYTYQGTSAGDDYTDSNSSLVSDTKTNEGAQVEDDDSADMNDMYEQHNTIIEILNDLVDGNKSILVRNSLQSSATNGLWESMGVE